MADLHRQLARSLASVQLKQLRATLRQQNPHKGELQPKGSGGGDSPSELASALVAAAAAAGGKDGGGSGEAMLSAVSERPLPSSRVLGCLRRALAAGWADQVARRMRSAEWVSRMVAGAGAAGGVGGGGEEEGGSRHAVRYASCVLEEEVFLHPRSALHKVMRDSVFVGVWVSHPLACHFVMCPGEGGGGGGGGIPPPLLSVRVIIAGVWSVL